MTHRSAFTLIELILVIAIIGVLLAIFLPAVVKAREAALRTESMNNLRQISMAIQQFADANGGRPPTLHCRRTGPNHLRSLWFSLLPYVEHGNYYEEVIAGKRELSSDYTVNLYLSPADPTLRGGANSNGMVSYAANGQVFVGGSLTSIYQDGSSNTIAFAEHYSRNCQDVQFNWFACLIALNVLPPGFPSMHRGSFADFDPNADPYRPDRDDVFPVSSGNPAMTVGSVKTLTFQTRPRIADCDPRIAQTPHRGGMLAALGDGSVRVLAESMSASTYWAAVTPRSGDILGAEW